MYSGQKLSFVLFVTVGILFDIAKVPGVPFLALWSLLLVIFGTILTFEKIYVRNFGLDRYAVIWCLALGLGVVAAGATASLNELVKVFVYLGCIVSAFALFSRFDRKDSTATIFWCYVLGSVGIFALEVVIFPNIVFLRRQITFNSLYPEYTYSAYLILSSGGSLLTDSGIGRLLGFNAIRLVGFNYEPSFVAIGYTFLAVYTTSAFRGGTRYGLAKRYLGVLVVGVGLTIACQSLSIALAVFGAMAVWATERIPRRVGSILLAVVFASSVVICLWIILHGYILNARFEYWARAFGVGSFVYPGDTTMYESAFAWDYLPGPADFILTSIGMTLAILRNRRVFPLVLLIAYSTFAIYTFSMQILVGYGLWLLVHGGHTKREGASVRLVAVDA